MLVTTGYAIAGLVGLGITVIGLRFLIDPNGAALGFGIPAPLPEGGNFRAWLATKGIRDIASGLFIFLLMTQAPRPLAGEFLLVASLIPLGDAAAVQRAGGRLAAALGIHALTALVMIFGGACLILA